MCGVHCVPVERQHTNWTAPTAAAAVLLLVLPYCWVHAGLERRQHGPVTGEHVIGSSVLKVC